MKPLTRIRFWLAVLIAGLIVSGVTAFPLETESAWLVNTLKNGPWSSAASSLGLASWLERVAEGVGSTNGRYPFLAYGTDWLAFAHLVIAVVFVGPYLDPVRNKWVITFGLIACAGVLPLALIAGQARHIPFGWRLIDCSFGVFGSLPLLRCRQLIGEMERELSYSPGPLP